MDFDFDNVDIVEFGVGFDDDNGRTFVAVIVDTSVQEALIEMALATRDALLDMEPSGYNPAEKYSAKEHLTLPVESNLAIALRALHLAENLEIDMSALQDPSEIHLYFARFVDKRGKRLTAVRRANHFKGVLRKPLLRLTSDALEVIKDRVFKLDSDFDLLIDDHYIHIMRPASFVYVAELREAVLNAVPENISALKTSLPYLSFDSIKEYAGRHPRAARLLASIRSSNEGKVINPDKLKSACKRMGIELHDIDGTIYVANENQILDFLEVLDRRRYEVDLVDGEPEAYKAYSRRPVQASKG